MAEPSEEAITDFVSFTGTSREQAISYLKVIAMYLFFIFSPY